jgi:hypothetical protein
MRKTIKNWLPVAAALILTTMGAIPVFAASSNTPVAGTTVTFDSYLVLKDDQPVPEATFSYAVTAGTARNYSVGAGTDVVQVLAGISPGNVTIAGVGTGAAAGQVKYSSEDAKTAYASMPVTDLVKNISAGESYAKKTATVNFSGVTFTEPGIYRYIVTESGTNQGVTNDADLTRVIDVYVTNTAASAGAAATGTLQIAGYVLHANEDDVAMGGDYGSTNPASADATKSQGFTNKYASESITIGQSVNGNQASLDKYFKITVLIGNTSEGMTYSVNLANADASTGEANAATLPAYAGQTNPSTITVPAGETSVSVDYYLQGGQSIVISGLATGTTVTATETKEDYKAQYAIVGDGAADLTVGNVAGPITINGDSATANSISFTNTRSGAVPTGVVISFLPYMIIGIIGVAGIVYVYKKKGKGGSIK